MNELYEFTVKDWKPSVTFSPGTADVHHLSSSPHKLVQPSSLWLACSSEGISPNVGGGASVWLRRCSCRNLASAAVNTQSSPTIQSHLWQGWTEPTQTKISSETPTEKSVTVRAQMKLAMVSMCGNMVQHNFLMLISTRTYQMLKLKFNGSNT